MNDIIDIESLSHDGLFEIFESIPSDDDSYIDECIDDEDNFISQVSE